MFGYDFVAFSSLAIAIIGFLVWGHHMFVSGQSVYAGLVFSLPDHAGRRAFGHQDLQLDRHALQGSVWHAPMLYAIGFIGLFTIGGLTGLFLGTMGWTCHLHDTYFVVAHFHYVMVGGMVMAFLGGIHFWWPKMTGRCIPRPLAKFCAILVFVGFNFTFFPQFLCSGGWACRAATTPITPEFQVLNVLSTAGATCCSARAS
jgi:cytochrome c oxidase subunit 1